MIKIKTGDIVNSIGALNNLIALSFPIKVSYRIKRLITKLSPIIKDYNEERNELLKKYGIIDEKGRVTFPSSENEKECDSKIKELQSVEESVEFEPISILELGNINIAPENLIEFVFTE